MLFFCVVASVLHSTVLCLLLTVRMVRLVHCTCWLILTCNRCLCCACTAATQDKVRYSKAMAEYKASGGGAEPEGSDGDGDE